MADATLNEMLLRKKENNNSIQIKMFTPGDPSGLRSTPSTSLCILLQRGQMFVEGYCSLFLSVISDSDNNE